MPLPRPSVPLLFGTAAVAVIAETFVAWRDGLPLWLLIPLAVATAGIVLIAGVALDALARGDIRPDRGDIVAVRDLQHRNAASLDAHAEWLAQAEARLVFLCTQHDIATRFHDLGQAGARIETWDTVAADLPAWTAAVDAWGADLHRMQAGLAPDLSPPSDAETQAARALLPPTRNFSSADLKAALTYLVQRERVSAAYDRLQAYGRMLNDRSG